jgi:hypothetical protein
MAELQRTLLRDFRQGRLHAVEVSLRAIVPRSRWLPNDRPRLPRWIFELLIEDNLDCSELVALGDDDREVGLRGHTGSLHTQSRSPAGSTLGTAVLATKVRRPGFDPVGATPRLSAAEPGTNIPSLLSAGLLKRSTDGREPRRFGG